MKKTLFLLATLFLSIYSFATPKTGKINNIVIFISFPDSPMSDSIFRNHYEKLFNGDKNSVNAYIKEASYGKSEVNNLFYPQIKNPNDASIAFCHRDTHSLKYYQPQTIENPVGFKDNMEYSERKKNIISHFLSLIQNELPVDSNNINKTDWEHVIFVFNSEGISGCLRWDPPLSIGEKSLNIHSELFVDGNTNNVFVALYGLVLSMKVPFLFYFDASGNIINSSMGKWDIMSKGYVHPCAYTKFKYLKWIDTIPEITQAGTYTLHPLLSDTNNCYQIKSPVSEHEFFILEYRKAAQGTYEENLPGSGLTITRVNDLFIGNTHDDGDEIYIFRPLSETDSIPDWRFAAFTDKENRTSFNSTTTNPLCLLTDGSKGGISISNVKENADGTLSFTFDGFDVTPFIKCKDTLFFNNVSSFKNHLTIEETNLDSWYTSQSVNWIQSTSDFDKRIITFKTLSANNTGVDRIAEANIFLHNNIVKTITLIQNPAPTNIALTHNMHEFSIYPNPVSNGALKVESGELNIISIEIFNLFGQKVFSQIVNQNNVAISVNHLPKGVYVVRCKFANGGMNNVRILINK